MTLDEQLASALEDFSGVVSVSHADAVTFEAAYGMADREQARPNTVDTRFGIASGTKTFTALTVVSLVREGTLALDTTARSLLGTDLPLIADDVTVEHLLTHTSGIGDYADEDDEPGPDGYVLTVPCASLETTADYLPALDGFATKFAAGSRFGYCNSGFVVLALLAERATGRAFYDLVAERVFAPASMTRTAFLRMDELPEDAAVGYLEDGRPNVAVLPVRGNGDGGAFTTVGDVRRFWRALDAGDILPAPVVADMTRARYDAPAEDMRFGLGLWLAPSGPGVRSVGGDAGVGFWSSHHPETGRTSTVITNTEGGVLRVARALDAAYP